MHDFGSVDADKLVRRYEKTIAQMASRIVINNKNVVSMEDLRQVGRMAVLSASKTYDVSIGPFNSYVRRCIRNALIAEANRCSGVFIIDPRVQLQVNRYKRLLQEGLSDDAIMIELGINNHNTYNSLVNLASISTVEFHDVPDELHFCSREEILEKLKEYGLTPIQFHLVDLVITQPRRSRESIMRELGLGLTDFNRMKREIEEKILAQGDTDE